MSPGKPVLASMTSSFSEVIGEARVFSIRGHALPNAKFTNERILPQKAYWAPPDVEWVAE